MKAVFLDRDGVVNPLIYYEDHGIIDSPFVPGQFRLNEGVPEAIRRFHDLGFKVILISNQPGFAKGNFSRKTFEAVRQKMNDELASAGVALDGEYYCLHHPEATVPEYRTACGCRKPEPGLLLQAAAEHNLDLAECWMVGDGLTDVQAGKQAGCRTVLLARMKCDLCQYMEEMDARPDTVLSTLCEAVDFIKSN